MKGKQSNGCCIKAHEEQARTSVEMMHKLLVFLTVSSLLCVPISSFFLSQICLAIGLTVARRDEDGTHWKRPKGRIPFERKDSFEEKKLTEFCSNSSIVDVYLTRILALINDLQNNAAYQSILTSHWGNFIKYIQQPANKELVHKNCPDFIVGLKAAKEADRDVIIQQKNFARTIAKQMKGVMRDLNNGKAFQEFDS